ncbi:MAG TPA: BrnT family toxin, partial [Methylomirabilota bacterium]|nr:BrnT family toxin [Methylomirabilota bacterium]
MQFEWDQTKAAANLQKHGVSFQEARSVFGDPLATSVLDTEHVGDEQRWLTTG